MQQFKIICLVVGVILFTGCSKYGYVRLNYPQEPQVYLPENTHSIAVVNRSLTDEEAKQRKTLESIVTAEIGGSDRVASDESLKGVYDGIQNLQGVNMIFPETSRIEGTGTRETPEVLDWNLVADICETNNADVLLVLETFDSNSDLMLSTAKEQVGAILSGEVKKPSIPDKVEMNVLCYWRMYDPETKTIADQFQHTTYMTFDMRDKTPPLDALPKTAYAAGQEYISRFLPTYYTVKRDLYKKGKGKSKNKFKAGYRRAEVANWEDAIDIWKEVTNRAKQKSAGRACLNIAVAYEVLGDTEKALEWAQKSYQDYGDKLGRDYAKTLLRRRNLESNY